MRDTSVVLLFAGLDRPGGIGELDCQGYLKEGQQLVLGHHPSPLLICPTRLLPSRPPPAQVFGDAANPTSKLIRDLTYTEFCQLAPINAASGAAYVQTAGAGGKEALGFSRSSSSSLGRGSARSWERRLLRKLHNHSPAVPGDASLDAWDCTEEDHFPTLEQVGPPLGWLGVLCDPFLLDNCVRRAPG